MKSKLKYFFENSQYYENYKNIDHIILQYEEIKNEFKLSKKNYKKNLFLFIHEFIKCDVKDEYLEEYVLFLIEKFGFKKFEKELNNFDEGTLNKLCTIKSIKLYINKNMNDKKFIIRYCDPEFFLKRFFNKPKPHNAKYYNTDFNKNEKMINFFKKLDSYKKILDEKIKVGDNIKKYVKYSDGINKDITKLLNKMNAYDFKRDLSKKNHFKNMKTLIKTGFVNSVNMENAFITSVKLDNYKMVNFLIKNNVNINAKNGEAFYIAGTQGCNKIVKLLIDNGANIHIRDDFIFMNSYKFRYIELIELLIRTEPEYFSKNEKAREIVIRYKLDEFYEKFNIV